MPVRLTSEGRRNRRGKLAWAMLVCCLVSGLAAQTTTTLTIRGHQQALRLYGAPTGDPIVLSSGDGGWIHLAPHVAELMSGKGFFVVGFDSRGYLSSFTSGKQTLRPDEEPTDYRTLIEFASKANGNKPILIGVSEGAGLSVLAATDPATKVTISGVIALGLTDLNELGWRWKDSLIYLTHRTPDEPTFSATSVIGLVAPVPVAAIHSTHDEFVPVADVERILRSAGEPKRLTIVPASDHRFSDNLAEFDRRLIEAVEWVKQHTTR